LVNGEKNFRHDNSWMMIRSRWWSTAGADAWILAWAPCR
jgi:hypothetical protein